MSASLQEKSDTFPVRILNFLEMALMAAVVHMMVNPELLLMCVISTLAPRISSRRKVSRPSLISFGRAISFYFRCSGDFNHVIEGDSDGRVSKLEG